MTPIVPLRLTPADPVRQPVGQLSGAPSVRRYAGMYCGPHCVMKTHVARIRFDIHDGRHRPVWVADWTASPVRLRPKGDVR